MSDEPMQEKSEHQEQPVLRLKPLVKPCPACGNAIPENAVLCAHCGWNFQTGVKMHGAEEELLRKRKLTRSLKWSATVVFAGMVVAAVWWGVGHGDILRRWLGMGENKASGMESLAETRQIRLDQELPMYQVGDWVELEKTNGYIVSGVLVEAKDGLVTIDASGKARTIMMSSLTGRSRARVDKSFRDSIFLPGENNP